MKKENKKKKNWIYVFLGIVLLVVLVLHVLSKFSIIPFFANYQTQYETIISDAIFLFAFIFAMIPIIQASRNTTRMLADIRKEHGIEYTPITEEGKDDLDWMAKHYERADRITIFAGSFDWLGTNSRLKALILKLAQQDKLKLVSYRSEDKVLAAFTANDQEDLFQQLRLCFRFESELTDVVCTMVHKSPTENEFLFKSRSETIDHPFNASVISDTYRSGELLHILSQLSSPNKWGNAPTTALPQ